MAATVEICESNGAEAITHNVGDYDMGSTDAANLDPTANPITAGSNSYEKWLRFHVTNIDASNALDNFQIWLQSGTIDTEGFLKANTRTASQTGYSEATFATPKATASGEAVYDIEEADPTEANLGIEGSLSGQIVDAVDIADCDYLVLQYQTEANHPPGNIATLTIRWEYDEQ